MAARIRKGTKNQPWAESTRQKIQASRIIEELEKHIFGKRKMTSTQVSASLGLLKKSLPDLQKTELATDGGGAIEVILNITKSPKG